MFTIKTECGCSIELHPITGEICYCANPECKQPHQAQEKPYINMKIASIHPGDHKEIIADVLWVTEDDDDGTETFH